MWFRPDKKNKRFKRTQVLEVKLSAQKTAALRWRLATTVLSATLGTLLMVLLIWRGGSWALENLVYQNEALAVQVIDIQTDGGLPLERLRQWLDVKLGDNLLALDLARIKRNLELVPLIKAAAVERRLPHTLRVRVTEREPLAKAHVVIPRRDHDGYEVAVYFLDEEGYVMLPLQHGTGELDPLLTNDSFSVLTGFHRGDLRPGRPVESGQVLAALRLIEAFERSPMFGLADLARIDLSTAEVLQVSTSQGCEVTFGLENQEPQLHRWRAIYDAGLRTGRVLASVDLSVTNNLPALWQPSGQPAPPKPKHFKTFHYKKKHV